MRVAVFRLGLPGVELAQDRGEAFGFRGEARHEEREHHGGEEIFHLIFLLVLGGDSWDSALAAHNESKDTIRHVKIWGDTCRHVAIQICQS